MRIELVFQPSMHQVFSMKCSQNTHLQGYSPDDPMIQLSWFCMMASGMRELVPCLDVEEAMHFCYFLPDFISSRSKILNQLRRYALQVSTVFNFPSRLPVAASACRDTEHQQFSCHLSTSEADAIILQCPHEQGSRGQLHVHHHPPTLHFSIHGSGL